MSVDSDFPAIETLLSELQRQIIVCGVVATLADLEAIRLQNRQLLARHDLEAIKRYADQFYSPLRLLALLCLEHRPPVCQQLLTACLQAGLYSDVLQLVDQLAPDDPSAAPLAVQACYRLALWPELLRYARSLNADMLGSALQLMITRAHLQVGCPGEALARLVHFQPQTAQEQRQLQILRLLARHRSGLFNAADLHLFLSLFPNATGSERAALAALWPAAEVLFTPSELTSSTLAVALRQFWLGLCQATVLMDGLELVPPLPCPASTERLAIVVADCAQLPLYEQLVQAILAQNNGEHEVHLVVLEPVSADLATSVPYLDLRGMSMPAMLRRLRQLKLDVVIDTVGHANSRWLELLSQRVAGLQIGWVAPDLAILQAPHVDALVVDRWTYPPENLLPQVKLLQLSGLAVLSHPSVLPQPRPSQQSAPVHPLQLVLLGSPDQLLPGTATLLRQILTLDPALTIALLDPSWSDPGLLAAWWFAQLPPPVPLQLRVVAGIEALESVDARCCIGLSINQCSPTFSSLQLISLGIPIVCLASSLQGSQPMRALLEALGLQAFVTSDPQHFLAILEELMTNPALRAQLSETLPAQLAQSLAMDLDQFASDLLEGLRLLKHAA